MSSRKRVKGVPRAFTLEEVKRACLCPGLLPSATWNLCYHFIHLLYLPRWWKDVLFLVSSSVSVIQFQLYQLTPFDQCLNSRVSFALWAFKEPFSRVWEDHLKSIILLGKSILLKVPIHYLTFHRLYSSMLQRGNVMLQWNSYHIEDSSNSRTTADATHLL